MSLSNAIFDLGLPEARELSGYNARMKSKLEKEFTAVSNRVSSFTNKMARGSNAIPTKDKRLINSRKALELVADDLCEELDRLGRRLNLQKKDDLAKFESTRKRVLSLWKEYQEVAADVITRTTKEEIRRRNK